MLQRINTPITSNQNTTNAIQALAMQEKWDEAIAQAEVWLAQHPQDAEMWYLHGSLHERKDNIAQAVTSYNTALKNKPDFIEVSNRLALLIEASGNWRVASNTWQYWLKLLRAKMEPVPDMPFSMEEARQLKQHFEEGNKWNAQGEYAKAAQEFAQGLAIYPDWLEALINYGTVLTHARELHKAEEALLKGLHLKPDHAVLLNALGNCYKEMGRPAKAIACYREAVIIDPQFQYAWANLARAYYLLKEYSEAIAPYEQALALSPNDVAALIERVHMMHMIGRWDGLAELRARMLDMLEKETKSVEPFMHTVHAPPRLHLRNAVAWSKFRHPLSRPYDRRTPLPADARKNGKLRIGYVSSDFQRHATAHLIGELFEQHDRDRFEIYAYSCGPEDKSIYRQRTEQSVDVFRDVHPISDSEAAALMQLDGIDIAIDLKGYTQGARPGIMAHRPAPVQMHYLGFPGTIGADFIDYFIADAISVEGCTKHFHEKLIMIPGCYQINDRKRPLPAGDTTRAQFGLPESGVVFAAFNNSYKNTPAMFAAWMHLLAQVEGSVLWVYESHEDVLGNLRKEAQKAGINPERIIGAPPMGIEEHISRYTHADMLLDTSPVCGHTTASDALWSAVPVVALEGDSFISRVSTSLLHAVHLPQLVALNLGQYEAIALDLARAPEKRAELRRHLTQGRMTLPLFDSTATTRAIEAAYEKAADIHRRGKKPESFKVKE